jgi:hypothetical protein
MLTLGTPYYYYYCQTNLQEECGSKRAATVISLQSHIDILSIHFINYPDSP